LEEEVDEPHGRSGLARPGGHHKEGAAFASCERLRDSANGFVLIRERKHLQEWIAKNPQTLGEELLIIQKEFSGFDDTKERLDLLALDKKGNLVVIENKLDDTGRDVVWQSLKYASYCSSLNTKGIKDILDEYLQKEGGSKNAQQALEEFFDDEDFEEKLNIGNSQRIIVVAGEFRKEVTSTALWLLNYGLKIQCFKVTAYRLGTDYLLHFDQIIPLKEAEEYLIKVASKSREELDHQEELESRYSVRFQFWSQFLKEINKHNSLCANISPARDQWIGIGLGKGGVSLNLVISRTYARAEIYINRGSKDENKRVFDHLYKQKDQIEKEFGGSLIWERMDDKVTSRIKHQLDGVNVNEESDYPQMNTFLVDATERMRKAFTGPISKID
jgi:hypothetical protein